MKPKIFPKTTPKVGQIFRPIYITLMIGGFNLIFNNNTFTKVVSRTYTTVLLTVICYANMGCCPSEKVSFIWSLSEYVVYATVLMFYESRIPLFLQTMDKLDQYLRVSMRYYLRTRARLYFIILIMCGIRILYTSVYCNMYRCFTSGILFGIYECSMFSLDVWRFWRYHLFEAIGYRLKLLRKRLEEIPEENYYLYVNKNKSIKENKMKFGLYLYKNVADLLDLISPELNVSLCMGIICGLPKLVLNVYRVLLVVSGRLPYESLGIMIFNIFQTSIFLLSPCIMVEMFQAEVERIRRYLIHKLMYETDREVKEDIQLFLQYTTIRDFRYKVCRIFTLDLQLPLMMISDCTTYVIIVVNFTKVLD